MFLDIDNREIRILSKDKQTFNLKFLNGLFNKTFYRSKNYNEESFKKVEATLFDNTFIKNNLYNNTLSNNIEQRESINIDKLQCLSDIDKLEEFEREFEEIKELRQLEEFEESKKLKKLENELNFSIKTKYYFNIKVCYYPNEVVYIIDLEGYELFDMLHLYNLLQSNLLYHFVDIYKFKNNKQYLNLKYNYNEIIKYLDKTNFRFNEFNLFIFVDLNKKEFERVFEFMRYSILQLHKLEFNYIELNKLYLLLSRYIYKNDINALFEFLHEFYYFKVRAYYNFDYKIKLKKLVLKDERFNLNISNEDEELGYINICFHEKPYYERYSISGNIEEDKEDLRERRKESSYLKGYKRNCHGFHNILGDVRSTELMYDDEFYKTHKYKNEHRRTH